MKLPKLVTRWVNKHIDEAWDEHYWACEAAGLDPHDVDPPDDWRDNLHIWLPEAPDWERTIDWGEIWATVWSPTRKRLKLCKVGWHSYTRGYSITQLYYCADCPATTKKVPRWAR